MRVALAFLQLFFLSAITLAADDSCGPNQSLSTHTVAYVYDGDTVRLADGKKVRFIGINTPELFPEEQPVAQEASISLDSLLKKHDYRIHLQLGTKTHDRYGRQLAHVFLPDGTNVTAWLLRRGLGVWIAVGENTAYLSCYQVAEISARNQQLMLWHPSRQTITPATALSPKNRGFYIISGSLQRAFSTDKALWLELQSGIRLRLKRQYVGNLSVQSYVKHIGNRLETRGWMYTSYGKLIMNIDHPSLIQFNFK